jgi:hypothetical protein
MPRSFEMRAESTASVDQLYSAFGDAAYWASRLTASAEGAATLESLAVGPDGTIEVATNVSLLRDRLPGLISSMLPGDLELAHTETWCWVGDGRLRGEVRYVVPGAHAFARGTIMLTPVGTGMEQACTVLTHVKIPVFGGAIERLVSTQLPGGILATQRFTTEWIDQNA